MQSVAANLVDALGQKLMVKGTNTQVEADIFQAQAQIQSVRTLVDGGVKLDVVTQELGAEDLARLFKLKGKLGWFVLKEAEVEAHEIPTEEVQLETTYKKPSQRLRNVLYRYWEQHTDQREDFDTVYYPKRMEKIIDQIKEKLA